jgi:Xaa-Pro dipeptidase
MWLTGAAAGLSVTRLSAQRGRPAADIGPVPASIAALTSMRDRAKPITNDERRARIEKARRLMAENNLDAILLTGGTSLVYFTGLRWGNSERLLAILIPKVGNPYVVCPAFEEDRAREQLALGPLAHTDVATWQEDESPFERVAQGLKDRGVATGRLGIEETTKFVFADTIASVAPALKVASATPVVAGCRMIKDSHELELMRLACEATLKCYEAVYLALKPGMTQNDVGGLLTAGFSRLGFPGGASVQVGEYTALPHGSLTPQTIREGTIIMMDNGCSAEGYQSDITRTYVLGKATDKMKKVFEIVHQAQTAALKAAPTGCPARGDRRGRAQSGDRWRIRPWLQVLQPPCRSRHGHGRTRVAVPREKQHVRLGKGAETAARNGVQRRAGNLHQGRVRRTARRRHVHHRERRGALHAAEPVDRRSVRQSLVVSR